MKRTLNIITIVLFFVNLSMAGNSGNGKKDQSTMLPSNVVVDPSTGEKVYTDQLMLAFKKGTTKDEKQVLVKNFQIKILSSTPSLNIYQVAFNNPEGSFSKLQRTLKQLQRSPKILYVYPIRLTFNIDSANKFLKNQNVQRKGSISLNHLENSLSHKKPKTINEAIIQHQGALSSCIEKKRRLKKDYHGFITVKLSISTSGDVKQARVIKSSVKDKQVITCFLNKIRNWRDFPSDAIRKGNRTVKFSFDF